MLPAVASAGSVIKTLLLSGSFICSNSSQATKAVYGKKDFDMNYKHPNLFVMIPYEERNRVSGYFDLSVVGEEYAKLLGDLTDELSTYAVSKNDVGENAVIIPILRAGMSMSNRLTKRLPKADVARISMRRNLHTLKPFVYNL